MSNNIFLDTEFYEDGERIHPLSIGLVKKNHREKKVEFYYAEYEETDRDSVGEWVRNHVLPSLGPADRLHNQNMRTRKEIAEDIKQFCGPGPHRFWCDWGAYDWVVFCQTFGTMIDLPTKEPYLFPMYFHEFQQFIENMSSEWKQSMPSYDESHTALIDAWKLMERYDHMMTKILAMRLIG